MITPRLSNAFQIANLFATILVVSIHYNTKRFIDVSDGITANYLFQESFINGVGRIAVPFFALTAGLFFFSRFNTLFDYYPQLRKRIRTIIIPYLFASTLIFVIEYCYRVLLKGMDFPIDPIKNILLAPLAIQFWFLRDLIILIIISPLIWVLTRYSGILFTSLLVGYWLAVDAEFMPFLEGRRLITIETLTFFSIGCWLSNKTDKLEQMLSNISGLQLTLLLLVYAALLSCRIYLAPFFGAPGSQATLSALLLQNTSIILGIFILLAMNYQRQNQKLLALSSYTFFVFLFHETPLNRLVVKFSDYFVLDAYKFYLTFPLAVFLTFLLAIMSEKYAYSVYSVVTGGRTKGKVLNRFKS